MSTSTKTVEIRILAVVGKRPSTFEKLVASLRRLMPKAPAQPQPKDQSYADYEETKAVLTGF